MWEKDHHTDYSIVSRKAKPQAPGSGLLSRNGVRENYVLRCAIYTHLEIQSAAKWHFSEITSAMTGFQIS